LTFTSGSIPDRVVFNYTTADYDPYSITLSWNNTLPSPTGEVSITSIGLASTISATVDSTITYVPGSNGPATYTLNLPGDPDSNSITRNFRLLLDRESHVPSLQFIITDIGTGIPVLSNRTANIYVDAIF
jgi:hypothetical protein